MNYFDFETILKDRLPFVDDLMLSRFQAMDALYRDWNSRINVISRKDMDNLYLHHVLHSLAVAGYLETVCGTGLSGKTVLDVGTGGGFPGIPLAILYPDASFTLCDSIGKKTLVASNVARSLGLENVTVVNDRAENLGRKFDYVVSRAVTSLDKFYPWVKGCFNEGILYLKGGDVAEEISRLMGTFRLPKGSVHPWRIDSWVNDPYYEEKLVIFIENFCK